MPWNNFVTFHYKKTKKSKGQLFSKTKQKVSYLQYSVKQNVLHYNRVPFMWKLYQHATQDICFYCIIDSWQSQVKRPILRIVSLNQQHDYKQKKTEAYENTHPKYLTKSHHASPFFI